MKVKKEYIILAAVIVLLSLYLIFRTRDRSHYELPDIPEISRQDITKIDIIKQDGTTTLNKTNSDWHIAPHDYLADKDKINAMLDVIEKLHLTALVSESKNYEIYDLGDTGRITVKAWSSEGSLKREFHMGKTAESYRHTYVKLPEDDRVYHASTNFRPKFDQTEEALRDKTVLSFDKSKITKITYIKGSKKLEFVRNQSGAEINASGETDVEKPAEPDEPAWKTTGKGKVDIKKLENLLNIVSKLKCENYITDREVEDFTRPALTLIFVGIQEHFLKVFDKGDEKAKKHSCISSGSAQPFEIPAYQAELFMESPLK